MFVATTDFDTKPYQLPDRTAANESFYDFLQHEEEQILRRLLGHKLYDDLVAVVESEDPLVSPWTELIFGAYYEYKEKTYQWKGLNEMLKPYIYYRWLIESEERVSRIGSVRGKPENAVMMSSGRKIMTAWGDFYRQVGKPTCDICVKNNLAGFLKVSTAEEFSNWNFSPAPRINYMGI